VESIEVLKGPAAVLYGRGSSGGLINRVSKKARLGETFGDAAITLGSFEQQRIEGDVNLPLGSAFAFRVTGAVEDTDSYRDQQFLKRYSIAPSIALELSSKTHATLRYENARDKRLTDFGIPSLNGRPVNVPESRYYGSINAAKDDTTESHISAITAIVEHVFSDALTLRNSARYYDYDLDRNNTLPNGGVDPVARTVGLGHTAIARQEDGWFNQSDLILKTTFGGIEQEWLFGAELGRQNKWQRVLQAGTIARVDIFNPQLPTVPAYTAAQLNANSAIPQRTILEVKALYAQDQISITQHWKALLGVRYDDYKQLTTPERTLPVLERTDRAWSPRGGLVWQPTMASSYYFSYSKSFQPSAESFNLTEAIAAAEPEVTENKEIGTKLDVFDGALGIMGAVFNLERSNIKNTDPLNPARQINVGTQRVRGVELSVNGKLPEALGAIELNVGYAYLDGEMIESVAVLSSPQTPVVSISSLGKTPSLTPKHSGYVWIQKTLGAGFSVGGGLNYSGERFTSLTNAVVLPSYLTADLAAYYDIGLWRIAVNVKNVTDRSYIVSAHGSNDNLIVPGAPRNASVTARYSF
jgi:catecholate siderophore receptor